MSGYNPGDLPGRRGKAYIRDQMRDTELRLGAHIHAHRVDGNEYCEGGSSECLLFSIQLEEAMAAWR